MTNTSSRSDRTMVLRSPGNERLLKLETLSARMVAVVGSKIDGKEKCFHWQTLFYYHLKFF